MPTFRLGKAAVSNILSYHKKLVSSPDDLVIVGTPFALNGTDGDIDTVADMTAISSANQTHVYHDGEDNSNVTNAINEAMCPNDSPVTHKCKAQDVVADLVIVVQNNPQLTAGEFKSVCCFFSVSQQFTFPVRLRSRQQHPFKLQLRRVGRRTLGGVLSELVRCENSY